MSRWKSSPRMVEYSLKVIEGPEAGRTYQLRPGLTLLGRLKRSKKDPEGSQRWSFEDQLISRTHLSIFWQSSSTAPWLTHLSRTNETLLDGSPVSKAPLQPGQTLSLGQTRLAVSSVGLRRQPFSNEFEDDPFNKALSLSADPVPELKLRVANLSQIRPLLGMMSFSAQEWGQDFDQAEVETTLRELLSSPHAGSCCLIAWGRDLIGYLTLSYRFSLYQGQAALIEDLYIHPRFRSEELVQTVVLNAAEGAKAVGCQHLKLQMRGRPPASELAGYQSDGFNACPGLAMVSQAPFVLD